MKVRSKINRSQLRGFLACLMLTVISILFVGKSAHVFAHNIHSHGCECSSHSDSEHDRGTCLVCNYELILINNSTEILLTPIILQVSADRTEYIQKQYHCNVITSTSRAPPVLV